MSSMGLCADAVSVPHQLVAAMEREMASKNPRSFEQLVSRISRDVPSLKNDVNDFVARVGDFVLSHFASKVDASPLLTELKKKVDARHEAGASSSQVSSCIQYHACLFVCVSVSVCACVCVCVGSVYCFHFGCTCADLCGAAAATTARGEAGA